MTTMTTVREEVIARLDAIIEWTLSEGQLKSADHRIAKRLAEEALAILEPPLDRTMRP